ncbi:MAG TPA: flagellar motor protein MotA, partial [Rhodospirillaceae bacterium]|nr:flagellar motor protein MotA [Rhodospirillaceae bacterium]
MSFTTLVGLLAAFGLFIGSVMMSTDNFLIFLSLSSLLMVVGGTLSATFISYEPRYVMLSLKLIWRILFSPKVGR